MDKAKAVYLKICIERLGKAPEDLTATEERALMRYMGLISLKDYAPVAL